MSKYHYTHRYTFISQTFLVFVADYVFAQRIPIFKIGLNSRVLGSLYNSTDKLKTNLRLLGSVPSKQASGKTFFFTEIITFSTGLHARARAHIQIPREHGKQGHIIPPKGRRGEADSETQLLHQQLTEPKH